MKRFFISLLVSLNFLCHAETITLVLESLPSLQFSATFPESVCVGEEFTIEYRIEQIGPESVVVPDWIQLVPDSTQTDGKTEFVSSEQTTGTIFDPFVNPQICPFESRGSWIISQLITQEGFFLDVTLKATQEGLLEFTSYILTDPPVPFGPISIDIRGTELQANDKSATVCPGESVMFSAITGNGGCDIALKSVTQPKHGTVTKNKEDNTFTYTAAAERPCPPKDCFSYTIKDQAGNTDSAQVFIKLACCTPCCDALEINPKNILICPDEKVRISVKRANSGCDLKLEQVTQPTNGGTVKISKDGRFIFYKPPADRPPGSVDTFTYTVSGNTGDTREEQTAPITIQFICDEPFEINPQEGEVCAGDVLCFDVTTGNSGCDLTLKAVTDPEFGIVVPNFENNTFLYTAPAKLPDNPVDMFTYTVTSRIFTPDGPVDLEATAPVTVDILQCTPCGDSFTVRPKEATVLPGESFTFDALAGNSGCDLMLESITQPINGGRSEIDLSTQTFTYFAPAERPPNGTDRFSYTMNAVVGPVDPATGPPIVQSKTAPVFITIPCDEEFIVNPKQETVGLGESVTIDALEGNTGCNLDLVGVTQPINGGSVTVDLLNDTITYTSPTTLPPPVIPPAPEAPNNPAGVFRSNFAVSQQAVSQQAVGAQEPCPPQVPTLDNLFQDFFTYTDKNDEGEEMTAMITITVRCNEPFTVNPKAQETQPGLCAVFDALEGNTGCALQLVGVTQPTIGNVVVDTTNNTFTYFSPANTPTPTTTTFTYTTTDASQATATATATATTTTTTATTTTTTTTTT